MSDWLAELELALVSALDTVSLVEVDELVGALFFPVAWEGWTDSDGFTKDDGSASGVAWLDDGVNSSSLN